MRRKVKKLLSVTLVAMMVTGLVADAQAVRIRRAVPEETSRLLLRFSWWGGDERNEATLKVIEAYEKEHPNVTIEAEYSGDDGYQAKNYLRHLQEKQRRILFRWDPDGCQVM